MYTHSIYDLPTKCSFLALLKKSQIYQDHIAPSMSNVEVTSLKSRDLGQQNLGCSITNFQPPMKYHPNKTPALDLLS